MGFRFSPVMDKTPLGGTPTCNRPTRRASLGVRTEVGGKDCCGGSCAVMVPKRKWIVGKCLALKAPASHGDWWGARLREFSCLDIE